MTRARSKRTSPVAQAIALAGCVVAVGAGGCGKSGSVVGGSCATGYTQCGSDCVDLTTDPENCGACGRACPAGVACAGGVCAGSPVTGGGDAQVDGPATDGGSTSMEASVDAPSGDSTLDSPADAPSTTDAPAESSSMRLTR